MASNRSQLGRFRPCHMANGWDLRCDLSAMLSLLFRDGGFPTERLHRQRVKSPERSVAISWGGHREDVIPPQPEERRRCGPFGYRRDCRRSPILRPSAVLPPGNSLVGSLATTVLTIQGCQTTHSKLFTRLNFTPTVTKSRGWSQPSPPLGRIRYLRRADISLRISFWASVFLICSRLSCSFRPFAIAISTLTKLPEK